MCKPQAKVPTPCLGPSRPGLYIFMAQKSLHKRVEACPYRKKESKYHSLPQMGNSFPKRMRVADRGESHRLSPG
jgi:hypothetical protein